MQVNSGHIGYRLSMMKDNMRRRTSSRDLKRYQRGRQAPEKPDLCTPTGSSPGWPPKDTSLVKYKLRTPRSGFSSEPPLSIDLYFPQSTLPQLPLHHLRRCLSSETQNSTLINSPPTITIVIVRTTSTSMDSVIWIHRILLAQASPTSARMSGETSTITPTSKPSPQRRCRCSHSTEGTPTRVSRISHPNDYRSKTHIPIAGYNSFHQGSSVPSSFLPSPQPATIPTLPLPAFPTHVPALSHGCKCLPIGCRDSLTYDRYIISPLLVPRFIRPADNPYPLPVRPRPGYRLPR